MFFHSSQFLLHLVEGLNQGINLAFLRGLLNGKSRELRFQLSNVLLCLCDTCLFASVLRIKLLDLIFKRFLLGRFMASALTYLPEPGFQFLIPLFFLLQLMPEALSLILERLILFFGLLDVFLDLLLKQTLLRKQILSLLPIFLDLAELFH